MKLFTKSNDPDTTLGVAERLAYGIGNAGNSVIYSAVSTILIYFYTDTMGLNPGVIGLLMLISRVFDGVTDLIMGRIVDRTNSRYGKARCWLIRCCVPLAVAGILLFTVPGNAPEPWQYLYVFVSYNIVNAILYTAVTVSFNTMSALMTRNAYERGLLGIFSMTGSVAVTILFNAVALNLVDMFGGGQRGWILMILLMSCMGLAFHLICILGTRERVQNDTQSRKEEPGLRESLSSLFHNSYWVIFLVINLCVWLMVGMVQTSTVYFAESVLNDAKKYSLLVNAQCICQIIFLFMSALTMKKIGKVNTLKLGVLVALLGSLLMCLAPTNLMILMAGSGIRGVGSGLAGGCMMGLLADVIDYGEWKTGLSVVGLGMAALSFVQKVGAGLANVIFGWFLNIGSYVSGSPVQPDSAIRMIKAGALYMPFFLCIIGLLASFGMKEKELERAREELIRRKKGEQA